MKCRSRGYLFAFIVVNLFTAVQTEDGVLLGTGRERAVQLKSRRRDCFYLSNS